MPAVTCGLWLCSWPYLPSPSAENFFLTFLYHQCTYSPGSFCYGLSSPSAIIRGSYLISGGPSSPRKSPTLLILIKILLIFIVSGLFCCFLSPNVLMLELPI